MLVQWNCYSQEPRFNEPLYNEVLGKTIDILHPREIKPQ